MTVEFAAGTGQNIVEAAGHPVGGGLIKEHYDPRLTNEDLAPLANQSWSTYNIFAFWMSDVHSVGGYLTAGSLFALGIAGWQVLVALVIGIVIVQVFVNLVAKPSQKTGVPYPVINRAIFGVKGANIPAIIRGLIAVACASARFSGSTASSCSAQSFASSPPPCRATAYTPAAGPSPTVATKTSAQTSSGTPRRTAAATRASARTGRGTPAAGMVGRATDVRIPDRATDRSTASMIGKPVA